MKPKLLILELWGLGDLIIATPFLQAASERYDVTLVAKPYAQDLQPVFWPRVRVLPFVAPWTAFTGKYRLWRWPWRGAMQLGTRLIRGKFDVALSARWDPRDHFLLMLSRSRRRLGFPRLGSKHFLTEPLAKPDPREHRYEYWRVIATALDLPLPPRDVLPFPPRVTAKSVLIHSGAGQPVRVWPLERYRRLAKRLREKGHHVIAVCDADQRSWWLEAGESQVATPETVSELMRLLHQTGVFIGNDSGPGHLAASCGVPTFTVFGPQLPEWFAPLHPAAAWLEGKACPYRPCSDYCRFERPRCLWNLSEEEVWPNVESFVELHLRGGNLKTEIQEV